MINQKSLQWTSFPNLKKSITDINYHHRKTIVENHLDCKELLSPQKIIENTCNVVRPFIQADILLIYQNYEAELCTCHAQLEDMLKGLRTPYWQIPQSIINLTDNNHYTDMNIA